MPGGERERSVFFVVMERFEKFLTGACAVLLASITAIVLVSVFFRYVLGDALSWSEEASRFLVVYVGLIGAATALYRDEHAAFTAVLVLFPKRLQKACHILNYLLIGAFAGVMLVYGAGLAADSGATAEIIPIPMWIPLMSVPLSGGVLLLVSLLKIVSELSPKAR